MNSDPNQQNCRYWSANNAFSYKDCYKHGKKLPFLSPTLPVSSPWAHVRHCLVKHLLKALVVAETHPILKLALEVLELVGR